MPLDRFLVASRGLNNDAGPLMRRNLAEKLREALLRVVETKRKVLRIDMSIQMMFADIDAYRGG